MASKKMKNLPPQPPSPAKKLKPARWDPRDGLGVYIEHPESYPPDLVVEYDDDFVLVSDQYPKASVHLLLLPRDPTMANTHPLKALSEDPAFLQAVRERVAKIKPMVANELRRQFGQYSASDKPYQDAYEALMSSPDPPTEETRAALPQGRDWLKEVFAGVHTHPSMNHLHVHIFTRDMHSPCMKVKKHYLSFNTSFLVQLDEFPLEEDSERFHAGEWPSLPMYCWRCGMNFQNRFKALKEHLEEEFEGWKRE
ncbi:HIT-like domain-containing protein [Lophiotrema nucula]|uniref:Aprataxin-like protein n=1 Tax=Lophiotrema nucula TaxID=690887 RepID=A0A6A5Z0M2_9PLEO|nr:HIT-like domain-containing protein [Lophiotrema nucula]